MRVNWFNPFPQIFLLLGMFLTAGRRKSFVCDSKSIGLCAACWRFRWILAGCFRPAKVVFKNRLGLFEYYV